MQLLAKPGIWQGLTVTNPVGGLVGVTRCILLAWPSTSRPTESSIVSSRNKLLDFFYYRPVGVTLHQTLAIISEKKTFSSAVRFPRTIGIVEIFFQEPGFSGSHRMRSCGEAGLDGPY